MTRGTVITVICSMKYTELNTNIQNICGHQLRSPLYTGFDCSSERRRPKRIHSSRELHLTCACCALDFSRTRVLRLDASRLAVSSPIIIVWRSSINSTVCVCVCVRRSTRKILAIHRIHFRACPIVHANGVSPLHHPFGYCARICLWLCARFYVCAPPRCEFTWSTDPLMNWFACGANAVR